MKALICFVRQAFMLAATLSLASSSFSQQVSKTIPNSTSPDGLIGFLEFRPKDYGSQKHPLIIFLHGIGERGNGTTEVNNVAANAIPKFCAAGATMQFTVGGVTSSFVVLSPQLSKSYGYWPVFYVKEMIKYAKANLQIDTNRIYITGLSLGGGGTWRVITNTDNFDHTFDAGIAAAAPVCGTQEETDADVCSTIGSNHLPVWAFHAMDDGTVGVGATQHAEIVLGWCNMTPAPKFTYYQWGGHAGAWVNAYDTGHITTTVNVNGVQQNFTASPNMYEWFLSNSRSSQATPNTPPNVNAGGGQTITLPVSSVTLNGTVSGTNGATISSYSWTKKSGPAAGTINTPGAINTTVTGLAQGTYVFTLTATDNHGLSTSSDVTIVVNAASNISPIANAGSNITITLPTNSVTLNGGASSDPDGSISSYAWSKTGGPATGNITTPAAASTTVTGLTQGVYTFSLTVIDNSGASASSTVTVTVNAAANQAPIANAGANTTITLPTSNVTLNGTASSDPDGTIASYAWTKTSGPSSYSISSASAASTNVTGLVQGVYVFTLTVTDNAGASATASVTITVNPAAPANQPPVANAGSNTSITLPTNNVTLDGSASSDPDGSIASYSWSKSSGPSSYAISNAGAVSTAINSLVEGTYVFTLTVTDNSGVSSSATVTVTVNAAAAPAAPATPAAAPNQAPTANAGSNASITLPANTVTLDGSASSDPDGTIASYSWTRTSGPSSYNIANSGSAGTAVNNLVEGTYVFTLTVTDNSGASSSADVTITVNPAAVPAQPAPPAAPVNQSPVANAGSNTAITLPVNSASLDGSASSDPDGSIVSYSWNKVSGNGAITIVNSNTAKPTVMGLQQGEYMFELTVTDDKGATATAQVRVTVNAAANQAPMANAGVDTSLALPVSTATLKGDKSSDADGNIVSYGWTEVSGPSTAQIAQSTAVRTAVNGLVEGDYVFELTVTDNQGAQSRARVKVSVINNVVYQYFKLYPNPATDVIHVEYIDKRTGKVQLLVHDVAGKLVMSKEYSKDQSLLRTDVIVSQFRSGMYYLTLLNQDGQRLIKPFVKQ